MRSVLVSAALAGCVVFVGVVSACAKSNSDDGGQGVCASNGTCANDGTPSSSEVDSCNAIVNGPCGSQFTAYANCAASSATCNSAGKSELPTGDCTSQATSYAQCMASDGGSTGTDGGTTSHDGSTSPDSGETFDTGTTGNDTGTTTGASYCGDIVTCVNNCTDSTCAQTCEAMGTTTAQSDFAAVVECLFGTDGMSGACGAMCGTETTACDNCLSTAQASGGTCYSQVSACSGDTTRTLPPVRNVGALPVAN